MKDQDQYRLIRDISASIIRAGRNIQFERGSPASLSGWMSQLAALPEAEAVQILHEAQEEALGALERLQNRRITNFVLQSTQEAALARWRNSYY